MIEVLVITLIFDKTAAISKNENSLFCEKIYTLEWLKKSALLSKIDKILFLLLLPNNYI